MGRARSWRKPGLLFALLFALQHAAHAARPAQSPSPSPSPPPPPAPTPTWRLLWADEFDGPALGPAWSAQIGDGSQYGLAGWGNYERQWYTDRPQNLRVDSASGHLIIQALYEEVPTMPGGQKYTSARIRTARLKNFVPDAVNKRLRIKARVKSDAGLGLWPAFWALPEDFSTNFAYCSGCGSYGGWAASGELDIMELRNYMATVVGSLHYGGKYPRNVLSAVQAPLQSTLDGWHTFAVDWSLEEITWYADGTPFFRMRPRQSRNDGGWYSSGPGAGRFSPFDKPFHLLLNLALGSEATTFTAVDGVGVTEAQLQVSLNGGATMRVDYVRVYGCSADLGQPCDGLP